MPAEAEPLDVQRSGAGAPALVFVHGGGCDRSDWNAQVAALSRDSRTIVFDLPGHGGSPVPADPGIRGLAEAVTGVVARHGGGGAVIVAHGMGCRVALEAVRRAPDNVLGLVLIDPSLLALGDAAGTLAGFEARLAAAGMEAFITAAFEGMFVEASDPALRRWIVERARGWDSGFARALMLDAIRWDAAEARHALAALRVPLLVIQSSCMVNFRPRSILPGMTTPFVDLARRETAALQVRLIHGVGHFAQHEAPDEVNGEIAAFAARLRN